MRLAGWRRMRLAGWIGTVKNTRRVKSITGAARLIIVAHTANASIWASAIVRSVIWALHTIRATIYLVQRKKIWRWTTTRKSRRNRNTTRRKSVERKFRIRIKFCRSRPNVVSNWLPMLLLHLVRLFVSSIAHTLYNSFAPPVTIHLHLPWRKYCFSLDKPGEQ